MNQSKRWIWSASRASFVGVVAAIVLGGCSLLFNNAEDGGIRDDSGQSIDAGIAGDGQIADAGIHVVDAAVADGAVNDASDTITFAVRCSTLTGIDLSCTCKLGEDVSVTVASVDAVCTLNRAMSGPSVLFTATTTKTVGGITKICMMFDWTVDSNTANCAGPTCLIDTDSVDTVTAECDDDEFL